MMKIIILLSGIVILSSVKSNVTNDGYYNIYNKNCNTYEGTYDIESVMLIVTYD